MLLNKVKAHEDRDGCNKSSTKPSTSESIKVLPSAIDDLIRVVERTNVEEIKEHPRKRAASIAASQARFPFQTSLEMLHRQVLNAAERETKATRPTTVEVSLDYQGQLLQLKMPLQVSLMK